MSTNTTLTIQDLINYLEALPKETEVLVWGTEPTCLVISIQPISQPIIQTTQGYDANDSYFVDDHLATELLERLEETTIYSLSDNLNKEDFIELVNSKPYISGGRNG